MNGIYLIQRTDDVGYDAVVVNAPDEPTALALAVEFAPEHRVTRSFKADGSNVKIREIIPSQEDVGILLGSFNAG